MSAFKRAAERIKDSKFVIPVCMFTIVGIIIGGFAFYEDYMSSYYGYKMLPTRKSGEEVITAIALLPQVGQIIFFYMFGSSVEIMASGKKKYNKLYFVVAIFLFSFDLYTDLMFKASGMAWDVWLIALLESITVYTIGSELLLTASIGILFELAPEALHQLGQVFARIFGDDEEEEAHKQSQRR